MALGRWKDGKKARPCWNAAVEGGFGCELCKGAGHAVAPNAGCVRGRGAWWHRMRVCNRP